MLKTITPELTTIFEHYAQVSKLRDRILSFSEHFLGRPYKSNPLLGSAHAEEVFLSDSDAFDCVTYTETVLALGFSFSVHEIPYHLLRLRYHNGQLDWFARNHYAVDWLERNEAQGYVYWKRVAHEVQVHRCLSCLADYPTCERELPFWEMGDFLNYAKREAKGGEIVFFGTEKQDLDVSHLGFLIPSESGILLRHASRQRGQVIDENLDAFLERFGASPGVFLAEATQPRVAQAS